MTNEEFIESITLDGEEWRDVVGYEGDYMVSNLGRIVVLSRLVNRKHRNGKDANYVIKPHICSTSISPSTNYRRMTFVREGVKDTQLVHRIVAEAFLPNPNEFPVVDHINDNPKDNRSCNLQWCTQKTNNNKPHHIEATSRSSKGRIPYNRRKVVQLTPNMTFVRSYEYMTLAKDDGFHYSGISMAIHGKIPLYKGYKWMYLSDYENLVISKSKNACPTLGC